jgi:hypothetical protein
MTLCVGRTAILYRFSGIRPEHHHQSNIQLSLKELVCPLTLSIAFVDKTSINELLLQPLYWKTL